MNTLDKNFRKAQKFIFATTEGQPVIIWEYLLMSAVLAGFLAAEISFFSPQEYTQLIVGNLAWGMDAKSSDYLAVLLAFGYATFFYCLFKMLGARICDRHGAAPALTFRKIGLYTLIPASIWLGQQVAGLDSFDWIWLSALLILQWMLLAVIFTRKQHLNFQSSKALFQCLSNSLLIPILAPLNAIAIAIAWSRFSLSLPPIFESSLMTLVYGLSGVFLILTWVLWFRNESDSRLNQQLSTLLLIAQALLPLMFWIILPPPLFMGGEKTWAAEVSSQLWLWAYLLVALAYVDLGRRFLRLFRSTPETLFSHTHFSAISPLTLLAILLLTKVFLFLPVLSIPADDYHFGEFLLPWWLWSDFSYLPFNDYFPARGLVNYVPGFLTDFFFKGTAAGYVIIYFGRSLLALPYLALCFLYLRRSVGLLPAFVALALMPSPSNGVFEIFFVLTACLCALAELWARRRWTGWLVVWAIASIALVLFATGQGGLFVLATLPLGAVAGFRAIRQEPQKLVFGLIGLTILLIGFVILTPLEQLVLGAIRYGVEQSAVNSEAYGIAWQQSAGTNPILGYTLWELLRSSWIVVGVVTAVLAYRVAGDRTWPSRSRFLALALPIVLLSLLWIPRAAGRIDAGGLSRLGLVSIWFVCLLLPMVLIVALGSRHKAEILLLTAVLSSLVPNLHPQLNPLTVADVLELPLKTLVANPEHWVAGDAIGLANLGNVMVEPSQKNRLQTIQAVLNQVLEPGETYLDLTNHNAHYFYLGYPPPIESGAFYNLVHNHQQVRAVADLQAQSPPLALVGADNLLHDGATAALRSHLVYRYLVENYIPIQFADYVYMIRPDRLAQINESTLSSLSASAVPSPTALATYDGSPATAKLNADGLKLLDQVFMVPDLQKVPSAWGRSADSLMAELAPVHDLDLQTARLENLQRLDDETWQGVGAPARIEFNLDPLALSGSEAGILMFDFACKEQKSVALRLSWTSDLEDSRAEETQSKVSFTAQNGTQIVPLDAAPRWLAAGQIKNAEFSH